MHIILANRWYPPESNGGIAVYNFNLVQGLLKLGHKVTVFTSSNSKGSKKTNHHKDIQIIPVQLPHYSRMYRLPLLGRYMREWQQFVYSVTVSRAIKRLSKSMYPNIVEFAEVNAEGFTYVSSKSRYPVVIRCHTPTFVLRDHYAQSEITYDTHLTIFMEKHCIRKANGITAPSNDMAQVIEQEFDDLKNKVTAIANPIDTNYYKFQKSTNLKYSKKDIVVLHVGRLERVKGIWVLAKAIAKISQSVPNVRYVFVGGDRQDAEGRSNLEQLKSFFQSTGVSQKVQFVIDADQDTLINCYAEADIAIVPSLNYESFSYTCAQAMSSGLPVIASRIGGIPETVDDGECGILFTPGDIKDLAEAIKTLANDGPLRQKMGLHGRNKAVDNFDSVVVARRIVSFYRSLI